MENVAFESTSVCTACSIYFTRCGLMSLFRGSCLGTHCSRGSCLASLSLEAGASSAVRSKAGALERELTASFQAACSITPFLPPALKSRWKSNSIVPVWRQRSFISAVTAHCGSETKVVHLRTLTDGLSVCLVLLYFLGGLR